MRLKWTFAKARQGFEYEDDAFRFTDEPAYAAGGFRKAGGARSGALEMTLGGRDDETVRGMSGGFTTGFRLEEEQNVTLTFRFKMTQSSAYLDNEFADLRVALDGAALSIGAAPGASGGQPYIARITGDGAGGGFQSTGWKTISIELGPLDAGLHDFTLGGFSNKKSSKWAYTKIAFDNVQIDAESPPEPPELDRFEAQVLWLTNQFRRENGVAPVTAEGNLMEAAFDWSRDMARGDFFRHSSLPDQFEQFGYSARGYGENIAAGYPTPRAVVQGWINSPGHRANLLREDFEHIGIGRYVPRESDGDTSYGIYWTQIFGDPSNDYFG